MTIRDISIAFGFDINKASEKKVNDTIESLKKTATKVLGAIAVVFSVKGLASLAEAAANAEALESQFTSVFGGMEEQAASSLRNIADNTGVAVNRMKSSFTQMASFAKTTGMDTADAMNLSERAMRAVADSAAFYDRSIEEVTGSLQSLLKGNFANDAALGLSVTETTRNAAANALYGKSFKDLAENQKQLTLLKMVEDANVLSGAMGQAAKESDTWGNQLGNLKQGIQDLKIVVGRSFLQPAIQVLKSLSYIAREVTKAISDLTEEGRLLNRMFNRVTNWLKRAQYYMESFIKRIGGAEKALKLLTIAAGAVFIAMNADKVLNFIKTVGRGVAGVTTKVLLVAAVVAILALLIEDFINFMQGNDSVIGELFKKAGIDAEKVRDTIQNAWNSVKTFLSNTWQFIQTTARQVFDGLKEFFLQHGDKIKSTLIDVWNGLKTALSKVWETVKAIATTVFDGLAAFWAKWGGDITNTFHEVFDGLLDFISGVFTGNWTKTFQGIGDIVGAVFGTINRILGGFAPVVWGIIAAITAYKAVLIVTSAVTKAMNAVQLVQKGIMAAVTAGQWLMNAAMTANPIGLIIAAIAALIAIFISLWNNNEGFRNFFIGMWEGIKATVATVVDWFGGAFETLKNAFGAVGDFFKSTIAKIVEFFQPFLDIISKVSDFIKGGLQKVGEFIGGIFGGGKDKGSSPIPAYAHGTNKTPDTFIAGDVNGRGGELVTGAKGRKVFTHAETGNIFQTLKDIAAIGLTAMTPRPETVDATTSLVENKSVVQNVEISNTFNGDRAGQQKSATAMDKASDDVSGFMARGLAYVR